MACHGAPGQAPAMLAAAMPPVPGPLQDASRQWRSRELAWIRAPQHHKPGSAMRDLGVDAAAAQAMAACLGRRH